MGWEEEIGGKPAGPGQIPVRDSGWFFINAPGCLLSACAPGSWVLVCCWWHMELSLEPFTPELFWGAMPYYLHWCLVAIPL